MVVDLLACVLTGASFARGAAQGGWGQTLWALDVEAFMPRAEFLARVDEQVAQIKGAGPRDDVGDALLVPGERSRRRADALRADGVVPLAPPAWEALERACQEMAVPLP